MASVVIVPLRGRADSRTPGRSHLPCEPRSDDPLAAMLAGRKREQDAFFLFGSLSSSSARSCASAHLEPGAPRHLEHVGELVERTARRVAREVDADDVAPRAADVLGAQPHGERDGRARCRRVARPIDAEQQPRHETAADGWVVRLLLGALPRLELGEHAEHSPHVPLDARVGERARRRAKLEIANVLGGEIREDLGPAGGCVRMPLAHAIPSHSQPLPIRDEACRRDAPLLQCVSPRLLS